MKYFFTLLVFFVSFSCFAQEHSLRPKVGLTLSGGGAKGLAHIGILKAIDSAGLKIDYITGTSMGAIIGALYAVGYSGKEIEKMQSELDWDVLFSNSIPLQVLSMEEKDEYSKYSAELPFINKKLRLTTGLIKGQELDLKFAQLFFSVYNINDFSKFKIPFKCMATDVETGNLVVLDTGNILNVLRATMAIPSLFSPVRVGNKSLLDGGMARNFPVKNVRDMGANIVIGSNVSVGLSKIDRLNNPVDVIMQMAFFKESIDFAEEVKQTNIYINMPLQKYTAGSFGSSKEIVEDGDKIGSTYYPQFKKLADSLNNLEKVDLSAKKEIINKPLFISQYEILGLKKTDELFFKHLLNFDLYKNYTALQINKCIRKAYGSRYYNSITYRIEQLKDSSNKIFFYAEENPSTFLKAGLYYSRFSGINVNVNITVRDFLLQNSRSKISLSIGESVQAQIEHLQYLGRVKNFAIIPGFQLEELNMNSFNNFKLDGSFKQINNKTFINLQTSNNNKVAVGLGTSFEYTHYRPKTEYTIEPKGWYTAFKTYVYVKYNTLNQVFFPEKGLKFNVEIGQVYNQTPHINFYQNNSQTIGPVLGFNNYPKLALDGIVFKKLNQKFTLLSDIQLGINFTKDPNVLNNFMIGSLSGSFKNQIRFTGLQEGVLNSSSVATYQVGLRYGFSSNIYFTGKANILFKDFITSGISTSKKTALTGYGLTFSYKTLLGPIELSAMYCDQSRHLQSYVLFGIPF